MNITPEKKNQICPYLGLQSDPGTALSFPSPKNFCFHGKTEEIISWRHQEKYCLEPQYNTCKIFTSDPSAPFPLSLTNTIEGKKPANYSWLKWSIALVLVVAVFFSAWRVLVHNDSRPAQETSTSAVGQTATVMLPSDTIFRSSDTPSTVKLLTPTPRLPQGLETPLGLNHRFVIHTIQSGESLELLAREYGTSMEAIRACNYLLLSPLIPGVVIIVPLNFVDMDGIPPFEAYHVLRETSMVDLASQLGVDLEEFKYYNVLGDGTIFQADEWVLVPRAATPGP